MRTLIIEDNAELARLLAERLNARGIDSDIAGSIVEANDYIAVGQFDTIMLDLGLPDGDGIDWLRGLPSDRSPVLILSARWMTGSPDSTRAQTTILSNRPKWTKSLPACVRLSAGRVTVTLWSCGLDGSPLTQLADRQKSTGTGSPSVARRLTSLRYSCVMPERSCPGNDWKAYFTALPIP